MSGWTQKRERDFGRGAHVYCPPLQRFITQNSAPILSCSPYLCRGRIIFEITKISYGCNSGLYVCSVGDVRAKRVSCTNKVTGFRRVSILASLSREIISCISEVTYPKMSTQTKKTQRTNTKYKMYFQRKIRSFLCLPFM